MINKLVLTPEELDELFREYEKEHSYEEGTWEKAISLATVKKFSGYLLGHSYLTTTGRKAIMGIKELDG